MAGVEVRRSDPNVRGARSQWGKPVDSSVAMPVDEFLVGDFITAAMPCDRERPILDVDTVNDQFIRNMVTLRMEERISLALQLPAALVKGDFGLVT